MEYVNVEIAAMVIPTMTFVAKFLPGKVMGMIDKRGKMLLAILIGVVIALVLGHKNPEMFADVVDTIIIGAVSGGTATGAFGAVSHLGC